MNKPIHPAVAEHVMQENVRLRGLLVEVAHCLRTSDEQPLYWEEKFASRIYRDLSQQAEPECGCCGQTGECDDDCDSRLFAKADAAPAQDDRLLARLFDIVEHATTDLGNVLVPHELADEVRAKLARPAQTDLAKALKQAAEALWEAGDFKSAALADKALAAQGGE